MDKLYSIRASAEFLGGISHHTVEAKLRDGLLKRTKVGRRTMVKESELLRYIESCGSAPSKVVPPSRKNYDAARNGAHEMAAQAA